MFLLLVVKFNAQNLCSIRNPLVINTKLNLCVVDVEFYFIVFFLIVGYGYWS